MKAKIAGIILASFCFQQTIAANIVSHFNPCDTMLIAAKGLKLTQAQKIIFDGLITRGYQPLVAEKLTTHLPTLSKTILKNKKSIPITVFRSAAVKPEDFDPQYNEHSHGAKNNEINTCTDMHRSLIFSLADNKVGTLIKMQIPPEVVAYKRDNLERHGHIDYVLDNSLFDRDLTPFIQQMWEVSNSKRPGYLSIDTPYKAADGKFTQIWVKEVALSK